MGTHINFDSTLLIRSANKAHGLPHTDPAGSRTGAPQDILQLGASGISMRDSMNLVVERALNKLLEVVDAARAELGIPEGVIIDTSAEATANRIIDFALGNFDKFRENHEELGNDEARQEFADFIGQAIAQGIQEAHDILTALNALDPETEDKITTIADIIAQRLEAFAAGSD